MQSKLTSQSILLTIQNICEFVLQNTRYPNDDYDEQHTTRALQKTAKLGTAHILQKVLM
jgi:hypothetical protein